MFALLGTPLGLLPIFPGPFLYGGLEEVGWRWFLQEHLYFSKHFITKMMVLSIVWFLWHIPIYQLLGLQQARPTISSFT
ncbi:MAG: type II CAAX prenyl endopeptidase Rce1 family protein [Streptococcus salivarius]